MCLHIHGIYTSLLSTVLALLADAMLCCFSLRVRRDLERIQLYVLESVQSCDDSEQLFQGENQQTFM